MKYKRWNCNNFICIFQSQFAVQTSQVCLMPWGVISSGTFLLQSCGTLRAAWMSTDTGTWGPRGRIENHQHLRCCLCPGRWTLVTRDSILGGEGGKHPLPTPCSLQPSQTHLRMVSANWGSDDNLRSRSWFWKTLLTLVYEWRKVGLFSWIFSTLFSSI